MIDLHARLGLDYASRIAVVGAGGKTSLAFRLIQNALRLGRRALFSTTTHIWRPKPEVFDQIYIGHPADAARHLLAAEWRSACFAAAALPPRSVPDTIDSLMPVDPVKLDGYSAAALYGLIRAVDPAAHAAVVVEADGARGRWLKAPGPHEPVVPAWVDAVCVVANVRVIGQHLTDRVAHRPELLGPLIDLEQGGRIDGEHLVRALCHNRGGRAGLPPHVRTIALLNCPAPPNGLPSKDNLHITLLNGLRAGGFDCAAAMDLRSASPDLIVV